MTTSGAVITETRDIDDGVVVCPAGEIDFSRSPNFNSELQQIAERKRPARLIVNLEGVQYMDSSGVATLVETMQRQSKQGGRLVLCCLQPKVASIFQISRLDMVFTIVDSEDDARTA